jgi:probable HAF family extracellular repeat protein
VAAVDDPKHFHAPRKREKTAVRTSKLHLVGVMILWSTGWCASTVAAAPLFIGLGDLPGADFSSIANGVSADGSVVVGRGSAFVTMHGEPISNVEAFRWTQGDGMVDLGDLPGGPYGHGASGVSADGSVVVGSSVNRAPVPNVQAFRWRQSTGAVGLGDLPGGYSYSSAAGVSANGSVIVGTSSSASGYEAFRWTQGGGIVGLGDLPDGQFNSRAFGVSDDGVVVVGQGTSAIGNEAFRWTQTDGTVGLGDLPGGTFSSTANGVSADGSVVVGRGSSASGSEAFRWTEGSGMVGLGDLPGGEFSSIATAVSADGSLVAGQSSSAAGLEAFLWDATHGIRNLRGVLVNNFGLGASLTGWTLTSANDISADGQFIVGSGTNPNGKTEAWLAHIEVEPTLPGDFNLDGTVNAADYVVWRKTDGTQFGYDTWRAHFGQSFFGSGVDVSVSLGVPESASLTLLAIGCLCATGRQRKRGTPELRRN